MSNEAYSDKKPEEADFRLEGGDSDDNASIPTFTALIEEGEISSI